MLESWAEITIAVFTSVLASSGLWAFIGTRMAKKDAKNDMIKGLGHDRIISLGLRYLERGYITEDEYDNLNEYLYKPYAELGGNGSAKKIMNEVEKLPIHKESNFKK